MAFARHHTRRAWASTAGLCVERNAEYRHARGRERRRNVRGFRPDLGMPSPKRIICVGHAALDRIYRIEAFPPEPTKVRALEHVEAGGGMAANASVAIARLGGKAEVWRRTGDDAPAGAIRRGP